MTTLQKLGCEKSGFAEHSTIVVALGWFEEYRAFFEWN